MKHMLDKIIAQKHREVETSMSRLPKMEMEAQARNVPAPKKFQAAIENKINKNEFALIAEIKKASPSKGLIREDFDPAQLAFSYEKGGATCLSVLTDVPFFQGHPVYLKEVSTASTLPVLRKDFFVDPYQVIEARAWGADCILIIMAAVSDSTALSLCNTAKNWGMDVLVEVHNKEELHRALKLNTKLIGINNRNLNTFKTTLETTEILAPLVNSDRIIISESGIARHDDLLQLDKVVGVKAFLVGECLMQQQDVEKATRDLLGITACSQPPLFMETPIDQTPLLDTDLPATILSNNAPQLSHINQKGEAHMVNISDKKNSHRTAIAEGFVSMGAETLNIVQNSLAKKGDVLATARIAGIMAAKKTPELIPLCHPLSLSTIEVNFKQKLTPPGIHITAMVKVDGKTGVEMEALSAVSIACLTIYDMLKAVDKTMSFSDIRLLHKEGGRSGTYHAENAAE